MPGWPSAAGCLRQSHRPALPARVADLHRTRIGRVSAISTSAISAGLRGALEIDRLHQRVGRSRRYAFEAVTAPPIGAGTSAPSYPWRPPSRVAPTTNRPASPMPSSRTRSTACSSFARTRRTRATRRDRAPPGRARGREQEASRRRDRPVGQPASQAILERLGRRRIVDDERRRRPPSRGASPAPWPRRPDRASRAPGCPLPATPRSACRGRAADGARVPARGAGRARRRRGCRARGGRDGRARGFGYRRRLRGRRRRGGPPSCTNWITCASVGKSRSLSLSSRGMS